MSRKHAKTVSQSLAAGPRVRGPSYGFAVLALILTACSSGRDDRTAASNDGLPPGVEQGFFRGGNVAGLEFASGAQSGKTGEGGGYTCETDGSITFSVGSVVLGETVCASVAHAAALTESGLPTDRAALNITRFLMTLDQDEDPENGISISGSLQSMADSWAPVDFAAVDFDSELTQIVADIASVEGRVVSVPDTAAAFVFLDASLSCAYSGVFIGFFSGALLAARISAALKVFREPADAEGAGSLLMIRQHPQLPLFLDSTAKITLETPPSVSNSDFFADFVTPDRVTGSWLNALTFQGVDKTGDFDLLRLGPRTGEYRFTGNVERDRVITTGQQLLARVELSLDGDTLSGRAFDLLTGVKLEVTGTRIGDSSDFEIEVANLGSATLTLILDSEGEPIGLEGGWPRFEGTVLVATGCRLT